MRAWGKEIKIGMNVCLRAQPAISGTILRVYPFDDKPNLLVKWKSGGIRTMTAAELKV